jgi:hypothetical protein
LKRDNKAKNLHITGLYMLRRQEAAWATKNRSRANALCAVFRSHIFAVAGNLRFPLSQPPKRHIQPERYAKWRLKLIGNFLKKYCINKMYMVKV